MVRLRQYRMVEGIGSYWNKRWEIQEKYKYFENDEWVHSWHLVFWSSNKAKCEEKLEKYKKEAEMEEKLRVYGFSDFVVKELLKGKVVNVSYGKVRLDKRNGILNTFYQNGVIKKEVLQEVNENEN